MVLLNEFGLLIDLSFYGFKLMEFLIYMIVLLFIDKK